MMMNIRLCSNNININQHLSDSVPPRQIMSQSEFGTGNEVSDLDFLNIQMEDSLSPTGRSLGLESQWKFGYVDQLL